MRFLANEVNQSFERDPTLNYEYERNRSQHALAAAGNSELENFVEGIDFLTQALENPLAPPTRWHHTDMYGEFDKWGYEVNSNLTDVGFVALRGVTTGGFEVSTKQWTPRGPYVPGTEISVRTDAIYLPNTAYNVLEFNVETETSKLTSVTSDEVGRINVSTNHEPHQFGIFQTGDPAELTVVGQIVDDRTQFLTQGLPGQLKLRLLNRGGSAASGVTATISTLERNVTIENPVIELGELAPGAVAWSPTIRINPNKEPPTNRTDHRIRFDIDFSDGGHEEVFVGQLFDVPDFMDIHVDDGVDVSRDRFGARGTGNGDGEVNPSK